MGKLYKWISLIVFLFFIVSIIFKIKYYVNENESNINNGVEEYIYNDSADSNFSKYSNIHRDKIVTKLNKSNSLHNKSVKKMTGIDHYLNYIESIKSPIRSNESSYSDAYLLTEYNKALEFRNKRAFSALNEFESSAVKDIAWKERGPVNLPGRIRGIAVNPQDNRIIYVGSVGGGVWKTNNAGETWSTITDYKIANLATSTIVLAPSNPKVLYVGTGEPFRNSGAISGSGIFKSIDSGNNWEFLESTNTIGSIGRMVINPTDENNIVVGSTEGIFVTVDGGVSWENTNLGNTIHDIRADPNNFNILYASVYKKGVYKSADSGFTWGQVFQSPRTVNRIEIGLSPKNPDRIVLSAYFVEDENDNNTKFYLSSDQASTFKELTFYSGTTSNSNLLTGQGWYDNTINGHPFNENVFYVGGVNLFKITVDDVNHKWSYHTMTDGYSQFNGYNNQVHVDQHNILPLITDINSQTFKLLAVNDGGFFYTSEGTDPGVANGDWSTKSMGLNVTQFYGASKKKGSDDYIAGAQDNGTYFSTGGNADKTKKYNFGIGGDGFEVVWNQVDGNLLLGGYQGGESVGNNARSTDGGLTWEFLGTASGLTGVAPFYNKLANVPNDPNTVFTTRSTGVGRSLDFGKTWTMTNLDKFDGDDSSADIAPSFANPDVVWVGNGIIDGTSTVSVSVNHGESFSPIQQPANGINAYLSGIETHPTDENTAYLLFSLKGQSKILETEDLGVTWTDISGFDSGNTAGFPDVAVHSLLVMPWDTDIIWAGTEIGLFETTDHGASWYFVDEIPSMAIYQMSIIDNQVVMATYGRGIWTAEIDELNGFEYPEYVTAPYIKNHFVNLNNENIIKYKLNNSFESIDVLVNGNLVQTITEVEYLSKGDFLSFATNLDIGEGKQLLKLVGKSNGKEYASEEISILHFNYSETKNFINNTPIGQSDFVSNDLFELSNIDGVFGKVLHNVGHPYAANTLFEAYFKQKLNISDTSNGELVINHIASTEVGYDFAYIEASNDGENWVQLLKRDGSSYQSWNATLSNYSLINDDAFEEDKINILNYFNSGDEVVFRLRFVTDQYTEKWGWVIKGFNVLNDINNEIKIIGQNEVIGVEDTNLKVSLTDIIVTNPNDDFPDGFSLKVTKGNDFSIIDDNTVLPSGDFNGLILIPIELYYGEELIDSYMLEASIISVIDDFEIPSSVTVLTSSETCFGSNNGKVEINVTTNKKYAARVLKAGRQIDYQEFENETTFEGIGAGEYSVCVGVINTNFEQCYTVSVNAGQTTSGSMAFDNSARSIQIEMNSGTAPYTVFVNGVRTQVSNSKSINVDAYNVHNIRVESEYDCEGTLEFKADEIEVLRPLVVYPNPIKEEMIIEIPKKLQGLNATLRIFDVSGREVNKIKNSSLPALFKSNVSNLKSGYYIAILKADGAKSITFKIVKK